MKPADVANEVLRAESRIRGHIRQTILQRSNYLSGSDGTNVYYKLESLQHTGSFKVRGALNKLLTLSAEELERGVVAASTGNHGAAVAYGRGITGASGVVFVPKNTASVKVERIERFGAKVRFFGLDTAETETYARRFAVQNDLKFISPYNDALVVGGQGTIGVELERQLKRIDVVFASLGGGGLVSGVAGYLKSVRPEVKVIGCSPENSQVMIQSIKAGKILDLPSQPTLSDGTAGGVEPGAITFNLCHRLVDEYLTVTEEEIKESLRLFIGREHMLLEGAAAVSLAAYLNTRRRFEGKNVVIVVCGANIDLETLKSVL
jgi:threonine dehydratase